VAGLASKPIIDIDVVVDLAEAVPGAIERLWALAAVTSLIASATSWSSPSPLAGRQGLERVRRLPQYRGLRQGLGGRCTDGGRHPRRAYRHEGNRGVPGREAFGSPPGLPIHHLYVVVSWSRSHLDHVLFRDPLRRDSEAAAGYAAEKGRHAHLLPANRPAYENAKSVIIEALIARARAEAGLSSDKGGTSSGAE
jgi:GrpB-like predicted nucleotidyltransferase (UPF0157 family)